MKRGVLYTVLRWLFALPVLLAATVALLMLFLFERAFGRPEGMATHSVSDFLSELADLSRKLLINTLTP